MEKAGYVIKEIVDTERSYVERIARITEVGPSDFVPLLAYAFAVCNRLTEHRSARPKC